MKVKVKLLSQSNSLSWSVAYQAPPSMGFSRQEYWSGLPFPSLEDLPNPGIKPSLPHCKQMLHRLSHQGNLQCSISNLVRARYIQWNIIQSCKGRKGTSLVVQWLRLQAPNAGGPGLILGWGSRSLMLQLRPDANK